MFLLFHGQIRTVSRIMSRKFTLDASAPVNRWMKDTLVKEAFRKSIPILAARVPPAKTGSMLKAPAMKGYYDTCGLEA